MVQGDTEMNEPTPSKPRPISPRYRSELDFDKGIVRFIRDDVNGNLTYEQVKRWLKHD